MRVVGQFGHNVRNLHNYYNDIKYCRTRQERAIDMIYPVKIPGFENQNIEVHQGLFTGAKLLFNGQPAPKEGWKMYLRRDDGSEVSASWKSEFLGFDVPKLIVDRKEIQVVKPLKWYEYVWSALPVLLLLYGGVIGLLLGILGFILNVRIFRSTTRRSLKFTFTAVATILTLVIDIVLHIMFGAIFQMACPLE